jgi:hypothetical protein
MEVMTVMELRAQAKNLGLKGYSKLKKNELIDMIQDASADSADSIPSEGISHCQIRTYSGKDQRLQQAATKLRKADRLLRALKAGHKVCSLNKVQRLYRMAADLVSRSAA